MGLNRNTPNCIVTELKYEDTSIKAVRRILNYEQMARKSEKKIVIECIKKIELNRVMEEKNIWVRDRKIFWIGME